MPEKVKKNFGPDPHPSPWLEVNFELMMKNKAKPYNPNASLWVSEKAVGGQVKDFK